MSRIPLPLIAFAIIWLLAVQVGTNIRIDAEESVGTFVDRVPFYMIIAAGVLLIAHQPQATIRWKALIACGLFFVHMSAVLTLTSDAPLRSYLIPDYGIASWMFLGMASSVAILTLERRIRQSHPKSSWQLVIWIPAVSLGLVLWALRQSIFDPGPVESYQFPAANLIVLLLFGLLALDRWGLACESRRGRSSAIPALSFLALGTGLSYFVSRLDSAAIVAVWSALTLALLWRFSISRGWKAILLFAPVVIAAASMFAASSFVEDFFAETRFEQLRSGSSILELSSLTSRLDILASFGQQFSVNPWFGHMEAEKVSGAGPGHYVHSLPLSALTHTGIVGATLLLGTIVFAAGIGRHPDHGFFPLMLFGLVVVFASALAFFTWVPFWYMIGYLTIRTTRTPPQRR